MQSVLSLEISHSMNTGRVNELTEYAYDMIINKFLSINGASRGYVACCHIFSHKSCNI